MTVIRRHWTWRTAITESDLPPTAKHVALTFSLYLNEKRDSAWPGVERLAADTSLHYQTVRTQLHLLVEKGWLELVKQGGVKGKRRTANEYRVSVPIAERPVAQDYPSNEGPPAEDSLMGSRGLTDPPHRTTPIVQGTDQRTSGDGGSQSYSGSQDWRDARAPTVGRNLTERDQGYGPDGFVKADPGRVAADLAAMRETLGPRRKS